jgi:hypothetical protein
MSGILNPLRPHILQQSVRQINYPWHQSTQTLVNQIRKMTNRFLLAHLKAEFFFHLKLENRKLYHKERITDFEDKKRRVRTVTRTASSLRDNVKRINRGTRTFQGNGNDLQNSFIRLNKNIRDIRINHQTKQIENQIRTLPQRRISRETKGFKLRIVGRRGATHAIDHFSRQFHLCGEGFWVSAENVAKIGVEKVTVWGDEEVV